jgi:hypothetical protein
MIILIASKNSVALLHVTLTAEMISHVFVLFIRSAIWNNVLFVLLS